MPSCAPSSSNRSQSCLQPTFPPCGQPPQYKFHKVPPGLISGGWVYKLMILQSYDYTNTWKRLQFLSFPEASCSHHKESWRRCDGTCQSPFSQLRSPAPICKARPEDLRADLRSVCCHHQHVYCSMSLASHLPTLWQKNERCPGSSPARF